MVWVLQVLFIFEQVLRQCLYKLYKFYTFCSRLCEQRVLRWAGIRTYVPMLTDRRRHTQTRLWGLCRTRLDSCAYAVAHPSERVRNSSRSEDPQPPGKKTWKLEMCVVVICVPLSPLCQCWTLTYLVKKFFAHARHIQHWLWGEGGIHKALRDTSWNLKFFFREVVCVPQALDVFVS